MDSGECSKELLAAPVRMVLLRRAIDGVADCELERAARRMGPSLVAERFETGEASLDDAAADGELGDAAAGDAAVGAGAEERLISDAERGAVAAEAGLAEKNGDDARWER
jgi:hypothetical protein